MIYKCHALAGIVIMELFVEEFVAFLNGQPLSESDADPKSKRQKTDPSETIFLRSADTDSSFQDLKAT